MKYLNKGFKIFLAVTLLATSFMCPVYRVHGQTLRELKAELEEKEKEYEAAKQAKELSEKEREEVNKKIKANEKKIEELKDESIKISEEITELNKSISEKYDEIKRIINTNQVMNGEEEYLEYIFGASSFADFIFRASVAEQLSKYNKELTDAMEKDVKAREEKQEEIKAKQDEISSLQQSLKVEYAKLGEKVTSLTEEMSNDYSDLTLLKNNIKQLQNTYNCSDDEDIEVCKERARRSTNIPASDGPFLRPIVNAIVTSEYGWYYPWGEKLWHAAMDLAGNPGSKIYASAPGRVVDVFTRACGNHIVYIAHNINGVRYTTGYWHMRTSYVSIGDLVDYDTVIGIQGGGSWEDTCSTGQHLDFVFTLGAYKTDYWDNPRSVAINPRLYLSFPPSDPVTMRSAEWTTR